MDNTPEEINKEISTLKELNELAKQESRDVQEAKLDFEPVKDVEKELANFTRQAFKLLTDEYDFQTKIENTLSKRLLLDQSDGGFNNAELITLHTNHSVNVADMISKVLGPTFQLMTAEQTANIQANAQMEKQKAQVQVNIQNNNSPDKQMLAANESGDVNTQVLQGIFQLQNLQTLFNIVDDTAKKIDAIDVEATPAQ